MAQAVVGCFFSTDLNAAPAYSCLFSTKSKVANYIWTNRKPPIGFLTEKLYLQQIFLPDSFDLFIFVTLLSSQESTRASADRVITLG